MNNYVRLVWIGWLLLSSSCNHFVDQQPTPDNGPPPGTVRALTQQYPEAQDILFTTIANNQLWRATFTQQRQLYRALTSPSRLLTSDQLMSGSLPDSLTRILKQTVVSGGTYSNPYFREYTGWNNPEFISGPPNYVYADYTWQQQTYTARWYISRSASGVPFYNVELLPFQQASYETGRPTDLPETIQAILRDQDLTCTHAVIVVDAFQKRQYTLSVSRQNQYWQLTYDDAGQLLTIANGQNAQTIQQIDQLPTAIQTYLQRPELAGFDLSRLGALYGYTTRQSYGSQSTYRVSLIKDKQGWLLFFSDSGQLISRSFMTISY